MNRRELFQRLAGAAAAAGVPAIAAEAHEAPCDPARALVVITTDRHLTIEQQLRIKEAWMDVITGTPWQGARAVVLDRGMTLEVHDIERIRFGGRVR